MHTPCLPARGHQDNQGWLGDEEGAVIPALIAAQAKVNISGSMHSQDQEPSEYKSSR